MWHTAAHGRVEKIAEANLNSDQTSGSNRVSIVVPIHNRSAMLDHLLVAIGNQTHADIETIIVDDGSDDLNATIFEAICARTRFTGSIRYIRKDNGGASSARNAGVTHSTGAYLYFLDSDDLIFAAAITDLVVALQASSAAYCLGRVVDIDFSLRGDVFESHQDDPGNMLRAIEWCTHAALYRRDRLLALGGFDEALHVGEDTIFQMRVRLAHGVGARCGTFIGVRRRHHHGHLSLNSISAEDRSKFLIAAAGEITGNDLFRHEPRIVRFGSMALFLTILARVRGRRNDAFNAAFQAIVETLLHDCPRARTVMYWLAQGGADGRLVAASALVRAVRCGRSLIRVRRRMLRPRALRTSALTQSIKRLSTAITQADTQCGVAHRDDVA